MPKVTSEEQLRNWELVTCCRFAQGTTLKDTAMMDVEILEYVEKSDLLFSIRYLFIHLFIRTFK